MAHLVWWDILLRLVLSILLGGLLGWNRESAHKPAGVRTHILVCLGSALVMVVSIELYLNFSSPGMDPGRIAANIVSGIGFLGAGAIIHTSGGLIRGLTTAASIWMAAAIGMACGGGMFWVALMGALLALVVLTVVKWLLPFPVEEPDETQKAGAEPGRPRQ